MSKVKPRILVITPVHHISGVTSILEKAGRAAYLDDPTPRDVVRVIGNYHAVFTNPNKSRVFLGKEVIDVASQLRVICTASTGTTHIDKRYAAGKRIAVLSLTRDMSVIRKISSTAELAFGLTLAALRHIPAALDSVKKREWDYIRFVGRQLDHLTVGVVGYGRLGTLYARYAHAFGARVLIYDPYVQVRRKSLRQVPRIDMLIRQSDVIAFHVHVTPETEGVVNKGWFSKMKPTVVLVNTSRGEIINEQDLVVFLKKNPRAYIAADVVSGEVSQRERSPLWRYAQTASNVILTPHIGGMTVEGQQIAYNHAARKLLHFFEKHTL